jgi:3-phosphoglycerate kinase
MKLPSVKNLPVAGNKVLLRTDYDIPLNPIDTSRMEKSLPTIKYLLGQKAKVIIISHLGRPEGKVVPELSLRPVAEFLKLSTTQNSKF